MAIQNHIHISSTLLGSPEYSPDGKYRALQRRIAPEAIITWKRGLTGKLYLHLLVDVSGDPIIFENFEYQLKITAAEFTTLKSELGKRVYFVDHDHVADDADHTDHVKTYAFVAMEAVEPFTTALEDFMVNVTLVDDETVE